MSAARPIHRTRALAITGAALAVILSYTGQRLAAWVWFDAAPGAVLATVHVPFTWRLDLAMFHGVVVGSLLAVGVSEPRATSALRWAPAVVGLVSCACALAMVAVP